MKQRAKAGSSRKVGAALDDATNSTNPKLDTEQEQRHLWHSGAIYIVVCIFILFLYALSFALIHIAYNTDFFLSSVVEIGNEEQSSRSFSVTNARKHLQELVEFGPRHAGSTINEVEVPRFLLQKVDSLRSSIPRYSSAHIESEIQHSSGVFYHHFLNGFTNVYTNVTNVVVRMSWNSSEESATSSSVLVNAHYDSFFSSPGASDDGIGVAAMLEIMRVLIHGPPLKHPVIFLFNGAEENNQQAAHGFITSHRWAKTVRAVVNLEAIGAGGNELIFQCNSDWVAKVYASSVPYPSISVLAHELFKHIIWRASATDWATFMEFGPPGIVGTDSAYIDNGYVYHTPSDRFEIIPDRTIKHSGENLLAFVSALSNAPQLDEEYRDNRYPREGLHPKRSFAVFYDILGIYCIRYGWQMVITIHYSVAAFALILVWYKSPSSHRNLTRFLSLFVKKLSVFFISVLGTVGVGVVYAAIAPMRWYSGGLQLALFCYVVPALAFNHIGQQWVRLHTVEENHRAGLVFTSGIIIIGTTLEILTTHIAVYALVFSMLSDTFSGLLSSSLKRVFCNVSCTHGASLALGRGTAIILGAVINLPGFLFIMQTARNVLTLAVPMMGKIGTVVPSDPIIAALISVFVASLSCFPLIGVTLTDIFSPEYETKGYFQSDVVSSKINGDEAIMERPGNYLYSKVLFLISFLTLVACVSLKPYSTERPKRLWIQHIERSFIEPGKTLSDAGIWINGFDGLGLYPLRSTGKENLDGRYATHLRHSGDACVVWSPECYTKWPWLFPVAEALRHSFYIPSDPPDFPKTKDGKLGRLMVNTIPFLYDGSAICPGNAKVRGVQVSISGPSHQVFLVRDSIDPEKRRLVEWGFSGSTGDPARSVDLHEVPPVRPEGIHYAQVGFGLCKDRCHLQVVLAICGDAPVEIAVYGHFIEQQHTTALHSLDMDLPEWSKGAEWAHIVSQLVNQKV